MRNQHLLASRPILSADKMLVAEQVFASEQKLVAQHKWAELHWWLLRGGSEGVNGATGSSLCERDLVEAAALNQWWACNGMHQSQFPAGSFLAGHHQMSRLLRSSSDLQLHTASCAMNIGYDQHLFLARQMGNVVKSNISPALAQQRTAQPMRVAGLGNSGNPDAVAVKIFQQQIHGEKLLHRASRSSPSLSSGEGGWEADQHLLQVYLMDQQRKKDISLNRNNIRQG